MFLSLRTTARTTTGACQCSFDEPPYLKFPSKSAFVLETLLPGDRVTETTFSKSWLHSKCMCVCVKHPFTLSNVFFSISVSGVYYLFSETFGFSGQYHHHDFLRYLHFTFNNITLPQLLLIWGLGMKALSSLWTTYSTLLLSNMGT